MSAPKFNIMFLYLPILYYSKTEPEWAQELEQDVKEEAEKSGPVVHIHVQQDTLVRMQTDRSP